MATVQILKSVLLPPGKTAPQDSEILIRLPNMFVLFLAGEPKVNPFYETVRKDSEAWLSSQCSFDEVSQRTLSKTDFSYFCSIAVPDASPEELRTVCDWGNWVREFDNGRLKDDPLQAQELVDSLLAPMKDENERRTSYAEDPLVQVHTSVWKRIVMTSSPGIQRRFANAMTNYCHGCLKQVQSCSRGEYPTLRQMLESRRQSAGVSPLFALVEYAHKIDLPDSVFRSRSIQEIERIGIDLVLIQNDILSYCKEEKEGVIHNMVAICRRAGMTAQAAFDHVGDMLVSCYRDWHLALAELPSWGEGVDSEVQRYIGGVQSVVQESLNWSFRSGRYFGRENERVRRTGVVAVRPWGI